MFADRPQDYIPYARVEVIREAIGTDKMESKSFDGPVWIQAQRVIKYFEDTFLASYTVREKNKSGAHKVYNWPLETFAELATNCILHKEYAKEQYIGIYVYRDYLVFINHNRPVPPVTIEDLNEQVEFTDRNYLNPELKEMFFKLDLIQSYGSGIRRAKNALKRNGSPNLVYSPDNDNDDYTMVTVYINEEFARIRDEESGISSVDQEETGKKTGTKSEKRIIEIIQDNPEITINELVITTGLSRNGVRYVIDNLRKKGIIDREGTRKKGKWIIL